jgi:signal transduction histidine kinase
MQKDVDGDVASSTAMNNPAQEEAAQVKGDLEGPVMAQLREANENLVIATIHAQAMTEASERANQQKERFLAMLAHELRNPLAPIVNALAVLRRVATPEPLVPWAHDIIKRQVDNMTRLLDDLLDVSRVTTGKVALQKHPIAVSDVMLQAVETSRPSIDARNQHLTVAIPPTPLTIDGDLARLVQVFSNLLNNAAKYTQQRGAITFSGKQQGDAVVLRVADNGFGITAESLTGIFELFAQEDRSLARADGGLGIGLTVVRAIVEMHGGAVTATSPGPGQGSAFEVTLPLLETPASPHVRTPGGEHTPSEGRFRIALIEDNVDVSFSLKTLLQLMGHEVATAFDGASGVKLVQAERPQVVLCDIGLPGLDGYGVIMQLQKEMTPPLPVMIALTGYGLPEDRTRALTSGFDHHLVKPVNPEDLLRVIMAEGERI